MSLLKTLPSKKSHGKTLVNQHKAEHRETRRTSNRPISWRGPGRLGES